MAFTLACPECKTAFQTPPMRAGATITCPVCRGSIIVPGLASEPTSAPEPEHTPAEKSYPITVPERVIPSGRGMKTGPLVAFLFIGTLLLVLGGIIFALAMRRSKELDTPVVITKNQPKSKSTAELPPRKKVVEPQPRPPLVERDVRSDESLETQSSAKDDAAAFLLLLMFLCIGLAAIVIYFIPTIVAGFRGHTNLAGIFVLNLFLGWTGWFWVLALVWAVWNHAPHYHVHKHDHVHKHR